VGDGDRERDELAAAVSELEISVCEHRVMVCVWQRQRRFAGNV
jgi:hypothetical protein